MFHQNDKYLTLLFQCDKIKIATLTLCVDNIKNHQHKHQNPQNKFSWLSGGCSVSRNVVLFFFLYRIFSATRKWTLHRTRLRAPSEEKVFIVDILSVCVTVSCVDATCVCVLWWD